MIPSISPDTPPINKFRKIILLMFGFLFTILVCGVVWIILTSRLNNQPVTVVRDELKTTPFVLTQAKCDVCLLEAKPDYEKAVELANEGKFAEALTYFDTVIEKVPELGLAYEGRSICYWRLSRNQRSYAEHAEYLQRAIADIDKAISLGMTTGDDYYLRYSIYLTLVRDQEFREKYLLYQNIAIDNLKTAIRAGTSEEYVTQELARELFYAGRCDEGWETIERIHAADGISAPPKAALLTIEALGYLCEGKFDQSLDTIDAGLSIQYNPDRQFLRTIILSNLGRYEEALVQLDELLDQNPYYYGYRYYQRALVEYELGQKEQALADIENGSSYTWGRYQERSYVLGRIALDEGRKDDAIKHLQDAWSTLLMLYHNHSLIPQVERELAELGSGPPVSAVETTVSPTQMPTEMPFAGTAFQPNQVSKNSYGMPLPPDPILTLIENGTGEHDYSGNFYPVYQFQPTKSVHITSVKELTLHTLVDNPNHQPFLFFIWNIKTGEWTMLSPTGSETQVDTPEDYVDEQANLIVAIRYDDNEGGIIYNVWPKMIVVTEDGQELILSLHQ